MGNLLHVAVDDRSGVAYAELLPDERKGACSGFMARSLDFFSSLGVAVERVMTDNGPGCRSGEFNALLDAAGARHVYTRPYSPWQNGKVERMNRTIAQEWQYGRAWESEAERADALPAFIERYNREPCTARAGPAAHVAHPRYKQPIGTQQLGYLYRLVSVLDGFGCRWFCCLSDALWRKSARALRVTKMRGVL